MKQLLIFNIIFCVFSQSSIAQSIDEIFGLLPDEYTTFLTQEDKDQILRSNSVNLLNNNTNGTIVVSISQKTDSYLQLTYEFTSGHKGFICIEIKKFAISENECIVVYAKYGGSTRDFVQHSLKVFSCSMNNLLLLENTGLPETLSSQNFLKSNLPDSLYNDQRTLSTCYNLDSETDNAIEYSIHPQTEKFTSWIKAYSIVYIWNGSRFTEVTQ